MKLHLWTFVCIVIFGAVQGPPERKRSGRWRYLSNLFHGRGLSGESRGSTGASSSRQGRGRGTSPAEVPPGPPTSQQWPQPQLRPPSQLPQQWSFPQQQPQTQQRPPFQQRPPSYQWPPRAPRPPQPPQPPQPTQAAQPLPMLFPNYPYPAIPVTINARSEAVVTKIRGYIDKFYRQPGEMTPDELSQKKASLLQKVRFDTCPNHVSISDDNCQAALDEFQSIPRDLRGTCRSAFVAMCQWWPIRSGVQIHKCSIFVHGNPTVIPSITGLAFLLKDCVDGLRPEEYRQTVEREADGYMLGPQA